MIMHTRKPSSQRASRPAKLAIDPTPLLRGKRSWCLQHMDGTYFMLRPETVQEVDTLLETLRSVRRSLLERQLRRMA